MTTTVKEKELVTEKVLTESEAIELSKEVIRLEATTKAMKDKLKAYVEDNGSLLADDVIWNIQEAESWKYNPDKIKDFMKSLIIDGYTTNPYELVTFSKPKIDKLGLDEEYLKNFAQKSITKRFGKKKA